MKMTFDVNVLFVRDAMDGAYEYNWYMIYDIAIVYKYNVLRDETNYESKK
jgi:hypothetical protein